MRAKKILAGAVLTVALAGGGVALAASMASAGGTTAPAIGEIGQPVDGPVPPGVSFEMSEPGILTK
ncbi:hypothetical protein [Actinoplanes couchii]|uniref:Uncharacterized protein n=1 Tax=Actinoplanes couchii TaxID=403638 RepID=A0ABQ3XS29_9ACTN|nr:hypothetical protein [Actinoplanes couchii]MDR6318752.1 hypothetical protein [Actinoplanes couchii]GID61280.1 hypothetical protein Aco03nite_096840 [Actinoplanes couchii]